MIDDDLSFWTSCASATPEPGDLCEIRVRRNKILGESFERYRDGGASSLPFPCSIDSYGRWWNADGRGPKAIERPVTMWRPWRPLAR